MSDYCESKKVKVTIQENGIIRNQNGIIIARLDVDYTEIEIERCTKMNDPYFAYGRVGADEWDWRGFGRWMATQQKKDPKAYKEMDVGKILGLIQRLDELESKKDYGLFGPIVRIAVELLDTNWFSSIAEKGALGKLAVKDKTRRRLMAIRLRKIAEKSISRHKVKQ